MAPSLEFNGEDNNVILGGHTQQDDGVNLAIQWVSSIVFPLTLQAVTELGIFDIIAKSGEGAKLSANDIASQIGTNNPEAPIMLDRLLRYLASYSVLHCSILQDTQRLGSGSPQRLYSLTPASKYFLTDADGVSLGPFLALLMDKVPSQSWTKLKEVILEGGVAFKRVYGMHLFEYTRVDTGFNDVFNKGMLSSTTVTMKTILELYTGFEHINRLVDVGGGLGVNLKLITSKYPHIQGVNFDLPHVIEQAPSYVGVEHVGGDMFEGVPEGDAIFMKWILHDWGDEHCVKLLKNCYKAIPGDGKVIIVDTILPNVPQTTTTTKNAFTYDLFMLAQFPGGKERTQQEFMELATKSGFSGIKIILLLITIFYGDPRCLGPDYNSFTTIMLRPPIPSYYSVLPRLVNYDTGINYLQRTSSTSAFYTTRDSRSHSRKQQQSTKPRSSRQQFTSKGRGFTPHTNATPGNSKAPTKAFNHPVICQICKGKNHDALACPQRYNHAFQSKSLSPALAAMTLNEPEDSNAWIPDSGASAHMTYDAGILSNLRPYHGNKYVAIGNGVVLDISHTGDTLVPMPSGSSLSLKNDKKTGMILVKGTRKGDVYSLPQQINAQYSTRSNSSVKEEVFSVYM
ncbi:Winged helix-like DNA-binding domain superfamily [Sesbania bispinosa]|nr:Winged helix-like DNA-binding domain superfamily [Sesbania bispinosa]